MIDWLNAVLLGRNLSDIDGGSKQVIRCACHTGPIKRFLVHYEKGLRMTY